MHLQVFSFKLRGAFNKMAKLSPEERARGVITSSAGNHAQGVALAASKLVRQAGRQHGPQAAHCRSLCVESYSSTWSLITRLRHCSRCCWWG
jgi:hypothetical protein